MVINGFWIDDKVVELAQDLVNSGCEKAAYFKAALEVLYPEWRQLETEQDFRDFVDAFIEYTEME